MLHLVTEWAELDAGVIVQYNTIKPASREVSEETYPTLLASLGRALSYPTRFDRRHPTLRNVSYKQTDICIIIT